jgi:4-hydroxy-2-oxoglutarate aldolase
MRMVCSIQGIDEIQGSMKDDVLYDHFAEVASNIPIPLILYNMPANTGLNLSPSLVAKLAKHPNIVGIKDTSGNITQVSYFSPYF